MYFLTLLEAEIANDQVSDPFSISDHHIRMHQLTILQFDLQTHVNTHTDMTWEPLAALSKSLARLTRPSFKYILTSPASLLL